MIDRRRLLLASVAALPFGSAAKADSFPSGPFRILVPFGPGSATDQSARNIAEGLNRTFGVAAVVENKPGANGAIAAEVAAKAKPDGQTIFVCSNTAAASNVAMMKSLPYDPLKDFEAVTLIGRAPVFMIVNDKVEARTAAEFVALCKRQPGKINFGSGSASTRISGELLKAKAGIDMMHVPYKSTPAALQDLMAGHVQMCFADPVTSLPQVKAGTVRCLGVGSRGRYKLTPDIPTLIEQGIPDFELMTWTGVLLPRGVPAPVRAKLRDAVLKTITDPVYVERQAQGGSEISPSSPEEMQQIMVAEIALYREMMRIAGIEPE
ncbi:MAG: tripartite tricarboxylate transporter substrate binding protein [Reyranella sp.]|jgi:tripartite-type tricarboxylate transporter receptor subunit TctC|uniref:Bug family tripartite tricarboxylate transporter substrate binding protein n=1 Tax=Reyranella sp. TaxID=1929291 RepID=UPI002600BCA4|nr:tripartite tricarboxylate transporter substrate binding protein [Reyranella sp.]MBR2816815.1 tripartite tricarboxylate transporter substrate binding protein [Reyranella sp.]